MKKYFVFSDVHGEMSALEASLAEAGYDRYNKDHILISLGDNFDRGKESVGVYEILRSNKRSICIKGNHEFFLEEALENRNLTSSILFNYLHNGLDETLESFSHFCDFNKSDSNKVSKEYISAMIEEINSGYKDLLSWLKNMPYYYETEHYIFVHANIDGTIPDWKNTDPYFMVWDIDNIFSNIYNTKKTIIFGHYNTDIIREKIQENRVRENLLRMVAYGNQDKFRPVKIGQRIGIDGCSNLTKKINILVIEDEPIEEKTNNSENKDNIQENCIKINGNTVTINRECVNYPNFENMENTYINRTINMPNYTNIFRQDNFTVQVPVEETVTNTHM